MESMKMFEVSEAWKKAFPDAHVGVLAVRNVVNLAHHVELEKKKIELEQELREKYTDLDRSQLTALPVLQAYKAYYKRFKKTYHVQLQLESIVFKGKSIPGVAALVEAMFMAELKNLLLTAGHDLDVVRAPLRLDVSKGGEGYTLLRGEMQLLKRGDMFIANREGIVSSIIYGPDQRSRIRETTQSAIFTVYAPRGIGQEAVIAHLQDIEGYIQLFAPQRRVEMMDVLGSQ
jgi:DNA/RNA-binding domain of Phe-tRNA-synthetase-like protein